MPHQIKKKFVLNNESSTSKKLFKDVLKRFTEKTQTFELMVQFQSTVEKTDESSITEIKNKVSEEIIDQKERRRFVRKEMKIFNEDNLFYASQNAMNKDLFARLIDLFTKSN